MTKNFKKQPQRGATRSLLGADLSMFSSTIPIHGTHHTEKKSYEFIESQGNMTDVHCHLLKLSVKCDMYKKLSPLLISHVNWGKK